MYKLTVSIALGLLGFGLNFYPLTFLEQNQAHFFFGLVFPMLVSLAWGWKYGLLSATLGMGCQTLWFLSIPSHGWGQVIIIPLLTVWIVWHGWCAETKKNRVCTNPYLAEIPLRIFNTIILYTVFRWVFQFNPPPWAPEITATYAPLAFINLVAVTQLINAYIVLLIADALLNIDIIRRIFRLEEKKINTSYIISVAILFGCAFWIIDSIVDYLVFRVGEDSFLEALILELSPYKLYVRTAVFFACLLAGLLISKYLRQYKESEARFRSLVESSSDWVWEVDKNKRFTYSSPKVKDILGYQPEEIIGKTPFELMLPEEAQRVSKILKERLELHQPFTAVDSIKVHKDGRHIVNETSGVPFFDASGNFIGYRGIARDITKRKLAEKALRESEEKFRNLVESINDWLWEIDENNIFTYSSPLSRELLGYEPNELIGRSLFDFIPDDDAQQVEEIFMYSAENQESFVGMENIVLHKDGGEIFMDTSGTPIFDSSARFRGYRGIGRDITERKLVEEAFIKAKRTLQARNMFNNVLVRSTTEAQLQSEFCRLIVEIAGYRFAWVGFAEDDEEKRVRPVAHFGYEERYLETVNITWADTEMGQNPTGIAIRTGKAAVVQNIVENPQKSQFNPWCTQTIKQGYAAAIALPLLANNKAFGAITICSTETEAFDNDEIRLLQNLANDLAYGIIALRDAAERRAAEETLRQNERFLQGMFDAIQDGIRVLDRNLNVLRVNAWMEKIYASHKPLVGRKCYVYQNKKSPCSWCPSLKSIETGKTYSEIVPYPSLNNPRGWSEITTFPLKNDDGFVTGIIEYIKDITERKQAERVLEEYNRKLEREVEERTAAIVENNALMYATLEATADGILVVSFEGEILLYNQQFIDMWQIPSTIRKGNDYWKVVTFVSQQLKEPEQYRVRAEQVQTQPDVEHYDLLEFKDGMFYERYSKPYQLDTKTVGLVLSFRDITQRKQAEDALRASENKYRSILSQTSQGYWLIDAESKTTEVNQSLCQMLGHTQEEMIGKTPIEFLDEDKDLKVFKSQISQQPNQRNYEISLISKDGRSIPTWFNATTLRDEANHFMASFAMVTDLTEQKRAEETLARAKEAAEAANRAKSEFLANMSHELRTPLNGILGFAQILKYDKTLNAQQRDAIHTIQQSGEHLLTLLNDILDMSKVEAGKMELQPKDIHFKNFLKGIADIIQIRAQQKGTGFLYEFSSDLPIAVNADETRLRQVLINLLGNAVKFTELGKVTFKVSQRENKIHFQVEDTGHGIAPDELETIFQPFQQVGDQKHQNEGTGLGLPISKKLVEMMGGALNVKSTLGKGSVFWFDLALPFVNEWRPVDNIYERHVIGFKGKSRIILVVDDKNANRAVLVNLLSPLGFEVLEASNGEEGFEKALAKRPDVILMDLVMPVMDGFEATRRIRQSAKLPEVVIIAVSASAFKQDRQDSLAAGCDDFIAKPISTDEMLDKLHKQLKLEWVFDTDNPESQDSLQSLEEAPLVGPPAQEAKMLYKLAMQGNVGRLIEQASQLEKTDDKLKPFATKLRRLAEEFQVRKIRELIKLYL